MESEKHKVAFVVGCQRPWLALGRPLLFCTAQIDIENTFLTVLGFHLGTMSTFLLGWVIVGQKTLTIETEFVWLKSQFCAECLQVVLCEICYLNS